MNYKRRNPTIAVFNFCNCLPESQYNYNKRMYTLSGSLQLTVSDLRPSGLFLLKGSAIATCFFLGVFFRKKCIMCNVEDLPFSVLLNGRSDKNNTDRNTYAHGLSPIGNENLFSSQHCIYFILRCEF